MTPSIEQVIAITGSTAQDATTYYPHLVKAMQQFEITSIRRVSAFLATLSIESDKLSKVQEGLYYTNPVRLYNVFKSRFASIEEANQYIKNPRKLSLKVYDGFHGRGLIQITGVGNYKAAQEASGYPYVTYPDMLLQPMHAAMSAAWFWKKNGCNAVASNMKRVTRIVNGPALLKLEERIALYDAGIQTLTA